MKTHPVDILKDLINITSEQEKELREICDFEVNVIKCPSCNRFYEESKGMLHFAKHHPDEFKKAMMVAKEIFDGVFKSGAI